MSGLTSILIFGASGDLTHRKLIPALFNLYCKDRLGGNWRIMGVSRTEMTDDAFRAGLVQAMQALAPEKFKANYWEEFAARISYQAGDLDSLGDFRKLDDRLRQVETAAGGPANRVYYLAIRPQLYDMTIANLGQTGMADEDHGWRRVVIEKPFGRDLPSARALNKAVHQVLAEDQVYRIDHYLGKETVQNILVFRFANSLFEPVWNRNYIDYVQITATETIDVGHRAGYYDDVGVVRDMVQNHMLQLLSLVAMEPPASFEANALRNERVKLFASLRPIKPDQAASETVRGQYRGYREAKGVAADSQTATYAAMRLFVDNWRWQGVPFFLRSGKALAKKMTDINIVFKKPPHVMFPMPPGSQIVANNLAICIQPDEGIHFGFQAKVPDTAANMRTVEMNFHYADSFGELAIPEAYERLLLDILKGDASLFTRADGIELAWSFIDPILAGWEEDGAPALDLYEPGTWGPESANELLYRDGANWSLGCCND